jgi:hypothetical protein
MSPAVKPRLVMLTAIVCASAMTAGCSEIYYGRHDTISLNAGDAVATNIVTQTVDVWPVAAGEQRIVSDGHIVQGAVERYRTNKVTPPVGTGTSSVSYQSAQPTSAAAPSVSQ